LKEPGLIDRPLDEYDIDKLVGLKILWGILLGLWLVFVLLGRGGFIHLLLLVGVSVLAIDIVAMYRAALWGLSSKTPKENNPQPE
jgi:hypothetical protein